METNLTPARWNQIVSLVKTPAFYNAHLSSPAADTRSAQVTDVVASWGVGSPDLTDVILNLKFAGACYCELANGLTRRTRFSRHMRDARTFLEERLGRSPLV